MTSKKAPAAGMKEIRKILSGAGDDVVAAIRGTGASPAEILQAQILLEKVSPEEGDGKTAGKTPLYGRLGRVYDILQRGRQEDAAGHAGKPRFS